MSVETKSFSDADLVDYLDGTAQDALAHEIEVLLAQDDTFERRLRELDQPIPGLQNAFDLGAIAAPQMPAGLISERSNPVRRMAIPLALAASLAIGAVLPSLFEPAPDWVDIVASYQALYVTETLAGGRQDTALTQAVLAQAMDRLNVDLASATDVEGLVFKRVQMLGINEKPLIQMAYLDDTGRPFAFCVTLVSDADRPTQTSISHDLATASWVKDGVGFVLVGGTDETALSEVAKRFHTTS